MEFDKKQSKIKSVLGLSFQLAKAGFKLRNEGSYLGIIWYLLNPILTFALFFFVFSDRLGNDIPSYPLYLLLGIIMFNFFQNVTTESAKAIRENNGLLKSVNFPRESLVLSVLFKNLLSHFFEIALFFIVSLFFHIPAVRIIYYFLILIIFCLFVFGFSLILSAMTVYFIDLENIWAFISRIIWLATPIFYDIGGQTRLFYFNLLNPLYYFITAARDLIIYSKIPENWLILGMGIYALVFFVLGLVIFSKMKKKFAELI